MKYIIEIKPEYEDSFKGVMILGAKDSNLFVDTLAVENLEVLKQKADNEIKVGDEVEHSVKCFVVTVMDDEYVHGIAKDGTWCYASVKNARKTGRHFDIASILKEMQS